MAIFEIDNQMDNQMELNPTQPNSRKRLELKMLTIGPQILMFLPVAKYVIQLMQTLDICINVEAMT
jgi:hypothetical protein